MHTILWWWCWRPTCASRARSTVRPSPTWARYARSQAPRPTGMPGRRSVTPRIRPYARCQASKTGPWGSRYSTYARTGSALLLSVYTLHTPHTAAPGVCSARIDSFLAADRCQVRSTDSLRGRAPRGTYDSDWLATT